MLVYMAGNSNISTGVFNTEYTPSEGELFIKYFLEEQRFKFEQEVPMVNLLNDSKSHRRADFYLTNYKVYVEFYGRWNNTKKDREEYREKKRVFDQNNVPCVYLYPENLGIIEFSFYERLEKVLKGKGLKKELLRLRIKNFRYHHEANLFFLIFSLLIMFLAFYNGEKEEYLLILFISFGGIALYQIWQLVRGIVGFFWN